MAFLSDGEMLEKHCGGWSVIEVAGLSSPYMMKVNPNTYMADDGADG